MDWGMAAVLAKLLMTVTFIAAPCPDAVSVPACTHQGSSAIYIASDQFFYNPGEALWQRRHELGHQFDYRYLTDADRGTFLRLRHDARPWHSDPNSPNEQFAEAFAACSRSTKWPPSLGAGYDYVPTVTEHRRVCRWLVTTAHQRGAF